jgi:hypothetical protein
MAGTVSTGGTYYYYTKKGSNKVYLSVQPTESDTPFNRLSISGDSFQMLAVVRVSSNGVVLAETAGGGTPTTGTANAGSRF